MKVFNTSFTLQTEGRTEVSDITKLVREALHRSSVTTGIALVNTLHTTCALFVNEFQSALMDDITALGERLVPERGGFRHDDPRYSDCERGNAHAHLRLVECDLRDLSSVQHLVEQAAPDYIVHLAAQSFVASSWHTPAETLYTNSVSQVNLLESIRLKKENAPRFLAIGSSEEYGLVYEDELPIKETNPLRPLSPYAVSKVTQDLMGYQYFQSYRLPIVRTRAFNHEGPRRGDVFVTSNFSRQIAEIEVGKRSPVIQVGNLKARRDYTDVRDIVRGYWRLLESGEAGDVYNLCSGRAWAIQDVLDFLLQKSRVRDITVKEDPARL